jgi:hypothetical protein
MVRRWISEHYVWGRSGAFVPAVVVALTADFVTVIIVLPAMRVVVLDAQSSAAGTAGDNAVLLTTLVAALLSALIAGLLASFNILRRGIERMEDDKVRILARVERLADGVPLSDDAKYETIAILCRRQWCCREDARVLVNGFADERLITYLLNHLVPRSRVTQRAIESLRAQPPSPTQDVSGWSIPRH